LVEDLNKNDDENENADDEDSDADEANSSDDEDDEEEDESPLGKSALTFLREMMNAIRAKKFKLTRNLYFKIIESLI